MLDTQDKAFIKEQIDESVRASEERMTARIDESVRASETRLHAYIESAVMSQFRLLAEQNEAILEKLVPVSRIEALEDEVRFLRTIVQLHSEQLAELKKAQ